MSKIEFENTLKQYEGSYFYKLPSYLQGLIYNKFEYLQFEKDTQIKSYENFLKTIYLTAKDIEYCMEIWGEYVEEAIKIIRINKPYFIVKYDLLRDEFLREFSKDKQLCYVDIRQPLITYGFKRQWVVYAIFHIGDEIYPLTFDNRMWFTYDEINKIKREVLK